MRNQRIIQACTRRPICVLFANRPRINAAPFPPFTYSVYRQKRLLRSSANVSQSPAAAAAATVDTPYAGNNTPHHFGSPSHSPLTAPAIPTYNFRPERELGQQEERKNQNHVNGEGQWRHSGEISSRNGGGGLLNSELSHRDISLLGTRASKGTEEASFIQPNQFQQGLKFNFDSKCRLSPKEEQERQASLARQQQSNNLKDSQPAVQFQFSTTSRLNPREEQERKNSLARRAQKENSNAFSSRTLGNDSRQGPQWTMSRSQDRIANNGIGQRQNSRNSINAAPQQKFPTSYRIKMERQSPMDIYNDTSQNPPFDPQIVSNWSHLRKRSSQGIVEVTSQNSIQAQPSPISDPLSALNTGHRRKLPAKNIQDILRSQETQESQARQESIRRPVSREDIDRLLKQNETLRRGNNDNLNLKKDIETVSLDQSTFATAHKMHDAHKDGIVSVPLTSTGSAGLDQNGRQMNKRDKRDRESRFKGSEANDIEEEHAYQRERDRKKSPRNRRDDEDDEDYVEPRRRRGLRADDIDDIDDFEMIQSSSEKNQGRRHGTKQIISRDYSDEDWKLYQDDGDIDAPRSRRNKKKKQQAKKVVTPTPIYLPEYISVANLAEALRVRYKDFVRRMETLGFEGVQNDHVLDSESASLIAMEYNFEPRVAELQGDDDLYAAPEPEDKSALPPRPPIVTIMGHVDHGKTTILDFLRKSSVAATEFGGITQHIGAFSVPLGSGKTITFLDTPGHAAFLSMRQRGANMTDIVVLVVAADDSVKPQTIEAIKHAQAARVPIIVAINKIDKEEAAPSRVKQDLARHGVDVEDFGGETQVVCVSGKTGQGMEDLEESIITLSEILDHRADASGPVEGWIVEATTKKSGRVATVLVRRGTLKQGDILVAGLTWTRVRSLRNEAGALVESAGPGTPIEVDGWKEQPDAGAEVLQSQNEQKATNVIELRVEKEERERLSKDMEAINEARRLETERRAREEAVDGVETEQGINEDITTSGKLTIPLIIKADVSGSSEAVVDAVSAIGNSEVAPVILRSGVGAISEFDIEHAAAAKGHVVSFNTDIEPKISQMAELNNVKVLSHNIIYRLVDDVKALLSEKLPPTVTRKVTGEAEIAQIFSINIKGRQQMPVAGCKVRNGTVAKGSKVKVMRGTEVVYDGTLSSLKNAKKDVSEMRKGTECGISFDDWDGFQAGDQIQCYEEKSEKRYL